MAGHSQFKNIMHRKGAQDAKRAKAFTKLIRELTVAARLGGDDPESNPRLRTAINTAKAANMPKDNVERAIKRGTGGEDVDTYQEVRYEGYGPGGVALIIEALTDNRNRTASEVRAAFSKHGGNLGETNSVNFQFERLGYLQYKANAINYNTLFEAALEAGAENIEEEEESHVVYCSPDDVHDVRRALLSTCGEPESAALTWKPKLLVAAQGEHVAQLVKLLQALDDSDDVQNIFGNYEMTSDLVAAMEQ